MPSSLLSKVDLECCLIARVCDFHFRRVQRQRTLTGRAALGKSRKQGWKGAQRRGAARGGEPRYRRTKCRMMKTDTDNGGRSQADFKRRPSIAAGVEDRGRHGK